MFEMIDPADGGEEDPPIDAGELVAEAGAALESVEARQAADELAEMDADVTLLSAAATQRQLNLTGARQLSVAAHWADLHGVLDCLAGSAASVVSADGSAGRRKGREVLAQPGGDGTPAVAEFAPAELGAVLGISVMSAGSLIADALDLRHRLPRVWGRLQAGEVKVWVARGIARRTRRLSQSAAAAVDVKVAPLVATVPYGRLEKIVDAAILSADREQAEADTAAAEAERGVWVGTDTNHGVATMFAKAAAPDIAAFDRTLDMVARALKLLGDPDAHDIRRAKALGVLADPQAALDVVDQAEATRQAAPRDNANAQPGADDRRRRCMLGTATLYVHISGESLTGGDGVARVESIGPVLLGQVQQWLGSRTVRVQPVLDLQAIPAVDRYEVPDKMAEAIRLRTPADYFPYSASLTRDDDNEHIVPFVPIDDGGPPGQTGMDNLAHTNRRPHRLKTHGKWTVTQPRSGVWIWRSPHGYYFLVDHAGTTPLGKLWTHR